MRSRWIEIDGLIIDLKQVECVFWRLPAIGVNKVPHLQFKSGSIVQISQKTFYKIEKLLSPEKL